MAVEAQIRDVLLADSAVAALVGVRIYDMPAPQTAASPFVTYQMVGSNRAGETYDVEATYDVTGFQIDCWCNDTFSTSSNSRSDRVRAIARAVRAALNGAGLTGEDRVDLIRWDSWNDLNEAQTARRTLDFTLMIRGF